jgi:hypothetical protein
MNDSSNMDVTQIFTVDSSGSVSAMGFAHGAAGGTPSLTMSLYRVSNGVVQPSAFAASILSADYFAGIGPQTVPVCAYAEFSTLAPVTAVEQIAFRIQSPFAELWGPRSDVVQGAELVEIPGTDLAFRAYVIPEPATGVLLLIGCSLLFFTSTRASLCEKGYANFDHDKIFDMAHFDEVPNRIRWSENEFSHSLGAPATPTLRSTTGDSSRVP